MPPNIGIYDRCRGQMAENAEYTRRFSPLSSSPWPSVMYGNLD